MGKNIVLCGFMGCGKSSVGRQLAKKTKRKFIDLDRYIEKKNNATVSQIFASHGEDYFRELEHLACKEVSNENDLIIAAGGGTLLFDRNVTALSKNAVIVFLDTPLNVIKKRLENDTKRPLLQRADKDEYMQALYTKRYPVYEGACDYKLKSGAKPSAVVADIIIEKFSNVFEK